MQAHHSQDTANVPENLSMALVVICGLPAAGKTRRAQELKDFFESKNEDGRFSSIHVVGDEPLDISKSAYYERQSENAARGKQISAVKRLLGPKNLVILDGMTYIKGFRYQLFCEAKAAQVTSCVLYVGTPADQAKQFNENKSGEAWPADLFGELVFRFEEPNGMARWDSPLFVVTPEDSLPCDEMWDCLVNRKPKKPNASTLKSAAIAPDYLSMLNEITSQIVKEVLELHRNNPGGVVTLRDMEVQLPYAVSLPQLTRIRRNYIALNKQADLPAESVEEYFIQFLEKNWEVTS